MAYPSLPQSSSLGKKRKNSLREDEEKKDRCKPTSKNPSGAFDRGKEKTEKKCKKKLDLFFFPFCPFFVFFFKSPRKTCQPSYARPCHHPRS